MSGSCARLVCFRFERKKPRARSCVTLGGEPALFESNMESINEYTYVRLANRRAVDILAGIGVGSRGFQSLASSVEPHVTGNHHPSLGVLPYVCRARPLSGGWRLVWTLHPLPPWDASSTALRAIRSNLHPRAPTYPLLPGNSGARRDGVETLPRRPVHGW